MMFVLFDVAGTLFPFDTLKDRFREKGAPPELAETWIAKLMQCSLASALTGRYFDFYALARSVLSHVLMQARVGDQHLDALHACLHRIDPCRDAEACLHSLRADGHRLVALTNWRREDALGLLKSGGLWKWFERLCSADTVRACKPHHALYEHLFRTLFAGPYDCCIVSSHAADIISAESLGMNSVYVSGFEGQWPLPQKPAGLVVSRLEQAAKAVSDAFGKPAEADNADFIGKSSKWYGEA